MWEEVVRDKIYIELVQNAQNKKEFLAPLRKE
jgi:hypothetical protein